MNTSIDAEARLEAFDAAIVAGVSSEEEGQRRRRRSLWVPDDAACPRIWFVAPPTTVLPPSTATQRGPFRVTELLDMVERQVTLYA